MTDDSLAHLTTDLQSVAVVVIRRRGHPLVKSPVHKTASVERQRPAAQVFNRRIQRSSARGNRHIDVIGVSQTLLRPYLPTGAMGQEGAMGVHAGIAQTDPRDDVLSQETRECLAGDRKSTRLNSSHRCISY